MSDFEHECPEWDFMRIAADDPEFASCTCFTGPEAEAAYKKASQLVEIIGGEMSPFEIARICHAVNRAMCLAIGDLTQPTWEEAPIEIRDSCIRGVVSVLEDPMITPEAQHEKWMADRLSTGWVYGEVLDREKKIHPDLKPFAELPLENRAKSHLFIGTVNALRDR